MTSAPGMLLRSRLRLPSLLLSLLALLLAARPARAAGFTSYTGSFSDGAKYLIQVPANWNGTLLLYSHGYTPGPANPVPDLSTSFGGPLLAEGFALAASNYATTGWALEQAFVDQIAVLDKFEELVHAKPQRTIAWGHSLGGIITAGLVQLHPDRFSGALPMCGVLGGGVGTWNGALDSSFVLKELLAPNSPLQVAHITNPFGNYLLSDQIVTQAQATPAGRARIALAGAINNLPGWYDPATPEPGPHDYAAREFNQFLWLKSPDLVFSFAFRAELEARAGGNPSWNTGVDYRRQLARSIDRDEVVALYEAAGLSLEADLHTLQQAPRISADKHAFDYLAKNITFNGDLELPVLTIHTTGDGLVPVENEQSYGRVAREEGEGRLLRQAYVHRAGHCSFTAGEMLAALGALIHRLDTGRWGDVAEPHRLNDAANALGPPFNAAPPAYIDYSPAPYPRPFTAERGDDDE